MTIYRLKRGWRLVMLIAAPGTLAIAISAIYLDCGWFAGPIGFLVPVYLISLGSWVSLDENSVSHFDGIRITTLKRADILGRRVYPRFVLQPKSRSRPIVVPSHLFEFDSRWNEWLQSIPDLAAMEHAAALAELRAGHDDRAIGRGRLISRVLGFATLACVVWVSMYAGTRPLSMRNEGLQPALSRSPDRARTDPLRGDDLEHASWRPAHYPQQPHWPAYLLL